MRGKRRVSEWKRFSNRYIMRRQREWVRERGKEHARTTSAEKEKSWRKVIKMNYSPGKIEWWRQMKQMKVHLEWIENAVEHQLMAINHCMQNTLFASYFHKMRMDNLANDLMNFLPSPAPLNVLTRQRLSSLSIFIQHDDDYDVTFAIRMKHHHVCNIMLSLGPVHIQEQEKKTTTTELQ